MRRVVDVVCGEETMGALSKYVCSRRRRVECETMGSARAET
jgi:hypothetical protein